MGVIPTGQGRHVQHLDPGGARKPMFTRLLSRWPAGGGALLLVVALSGVVAAATVVTAVTAPRTERTHPPTVSDTTGAFQDTNGNGIDDACEQNVVADPAAAAAAEAAVDVDHDGTISVSEAAHSDRTGGKNCNHGGYVSSVAHAQADACQATTTGGGAAGAITNTVDGTDQAACTGADAGDSTDATDSTNTTEGRRQAPKAACQAVAAPQPPAQPDTAPNAHGKWVSSVARSGAIGGKHCNHGGAVSEAAKLGKAERDAAKAARKAERQAAKAIRKSQGH
jgi:hypothetical protein